MAESILRLRVQSDEYDNKLKRAADSIQRYADQCRKAGGTLEYVDEGMVEFARSLGKMETLSKSARGSVAELTKAYTDMAVEYNKMTEAEKNNPYGQAIKSSLDELKVRIQNGKKEIDDMTKEYNDKIDALFKEKEAEIMKI